MLYEKNFKQLSTPNHTYLYTYLYCIRYSSELFRRFPTRLYL